MYRFSSRENVHVRATNQQQSARAAKHAHTNRKHIRPEGRRHLQIHGSAFRARCRSDTSNSTVIGQHCKTSTAGAKKLQRNAKSQPRNELAISVTAKSRLHVVGKSSTTSCLPLRQHCWKHSKKRSGDGEGTQRNSTQTGQPECVATGPPKSSNSNAITHVIEPYLEVTASARNLRST